MKLAYIDLETTGTDPVQHAIHQIALLIEIGGEVVETHDIKLAIPSHKDIDFKAMHDLGVDTAEITTAKNGRLQYHEGFAHLLSILSKHVDRYDKSDKFHFIGYNSRFDMDFLRQFWKENNDNFFGSFFWHPPLDVMNLAAEDLMTVRHLLPNFELQTVYDWYAKAGMISRLDEAPAIEWHDALADIAATRNLYLTIK